MVERALEPITFSHAQLEHMCRPFFSHRGKLQTFTLLSGGAVNTTYKILWGDRSYVLRFYMRGPGLAQVEQDVYRRIQGQVPVPELLYTGFTQQQYPFAIFPFIPKKHLFEITDLSLGKTISFTLGKALAQIHHFRFPKAGLFGPGLKIDTLFEEGSNPYFSYTVKNLSESSLAWKRLGDKRAEALREFVYTHQDFFPIMQKGGVLVHSDFKPVNLLWEEKDGLTVLDWEFAHSGHPLIDFAVLLRHYRDFPLNTEVLETGYLESGGLLPEDWIQRAKITDIINIVQLLNAPTKRPSLFQFLIEIIDYLL